MKLRLLDTGAAPAALNMGIDEALLDHCSADPSAAALRLYSWTPRAVTVGYFQSLKEEVDLEACAAAGVDAVRRVTGGGAVFHDAEITYSLIVPEASVLAPADILDSYARICGGITAALGLLGIEAAFTPINDIQAGGKKVSGNAQTRKKGCLLQHGTILLGLDLEAMFSLLLVPKEKLAGKLIADAKARVTCLRELLGRELPYAEAATALAGGFAQAWAPLGVELCPSALEPAEAEAGARLAASRYSSPAWNLKR